MSEKKFSAFTSEGGKLGDEYYKKRETFHWQDAFMCYTDDRSAYLTSVQRARIRNILNQKKYNRRLLVLGGITLLLFLVFLFTDMYLAPLNTLIVIKVAISILEITAYGISLFLYIIKPYNSLFYMLPTMFILFFVYLTMYVL